MSKLSAFEEKRLLRVIEEHREKNGVFPTQRELEKAGFNKTGLQSAQKSGLIVQVYVKMTNGSMVKAYKQASKRGVL